MKKRSLKRTAQQFTRRGFLKASVFTTAAATGITGLSTHLLKARAAKVTAAKSAASALDIWNLPAFVPASGPYKADSTWKSFTSQYVFPSWYRDAKYGIWAHWSPQSVPEDGDWYALHMYQQGTSQYKYHLSHYGHPSKFGYKDITHLFTGSQWDAKALLKLYAQQGGAKYFMALANHHDNFDNWDSTYQPWNSQTVGRKSSIIGEWAAATRAEGIHFGVTYHAVPYLSWDLFLPARYNHDKTGSYAGVPYDGVTTKAQGAGKWWNGLDPVALNGTIHAATGSVNNYYPKDTDPNVRQFYWRIDDLINKYQPDILYFDDSVQNPNITDGRTNQQAYVIAANYYNKSLQWHNNTMEAVLTFKYLSTNARGGLVEDWEQTLAPTIQPYPWQAENSLGPWHYYAPKPITMTATQVIHALVNAVSKNGNYLINVPQHGDGHLDQAAITIVTGVGGWLKTYGEAIYATRPFAIYGEGTVYYTRKSSVVYAIAISWPGSTLSLPTLKKGSPYIGTVTNVELLGHSGTLSFTQSASALEITTPSGIPGSPAYAFKITQNKILTNNDDPGVVYAGTAWTHQVNRGVGNSNNNAHVTTNNGDSVSYTFTGTGVEFISETHSAHGKVDVYINGALHNTVNASSTTHATQVSLHHVQDLPFGKHTITLVKRSGQYMIVDAFKVL